MAKSSQISSTNPQTPNDISTSIVTTTKNRIKSIPYFLARRICTIVTNKNLRKNHLKKVHKTLHQKGYPTTLKKKKKGFELAEKNTRTSKPEKT